MRDLSRKGAFSDILHEHTPSNRPAPAAGHRQGRRRWAPLGTHHRRGGRAGRGGAPAPARRAAKRASRDGAGTPAGRQAGQRPGGPSPRQGACSPLRRRRQGGEHQARLRRRLGTLQSVGGGPGLLPPPGGPGACGGVHRDAGRQEAGLLDHRPGHCGHRLLPQDRQTEAIRLVPGTPRHRPPTSRHSANERGRAAEEEIADRPFPRPDCRETLRSQGAHVARHPDRGLLGGTPSERSAEDAAQSRALRDERRGRMVGRALAGTQDRSGEEGGGHRHGVVGREPDHLSRARDARVARSAPRRRSRLPVLGPSCCSSCATFGVEDWFSCGDVRRSLSSSWLHHDCSGR